MSWNLSFVFGLLCMLSSVCQNGAESEAEDSVNIEGSVDIEGTQLSKYIFWDLLTGQSQTTNEDHEEPGAIEGDVLRVLDSGDYITKRKPVTKAFRFWPYAVMPYTVAKSGKRAFSEPNKARAVIKEAMAAWEAVTCIRFLDIDSYGTDAAKAAYSKLKHADYVEFGHGKGCSSYVGRVRDKKKQYSDSKQTLNLNQKGCLSPGTIKHEIGHALGFNHEQGRSDRDHYVRILWDNIKAGFVANFMNKTTDNDVEYDLGSIMHYGKRSFSTGGDTINALDWKLNFLMANKNKLSFYDIKAMNDAYHCHANCNPNPTCENEGYIFDCYCVCPSVLCGDSCEVFKPAWSGAACNSKIVSLDKMESYEIKSPNYPLSYGQAQCGWLVTNPYNLTMTISMTLHDIPRHQRTHKCYHSVEIRYNIIAQEGPRNPVRIRICMLRGENYDMIWLCDEFQYAAGQDMWDSFCGETSTPYTMVSHKDSVLVLLHGTDPGYTGKGFKVKVALGQTEACNPNPCRRNVEYCTATDSAEGYKCTCFPNLSGVDCDVVDTILCNFEHHYGPEEFCLFSPSSAGQFNWTVNHGKTPSVKTGPGTGVSGHGVYLLAEGSSPAHTGWEAILISALISAGDKCLSFYYHMFGYNMGGMSVSAVSAANHTHRATWSKKGNQYNQWRIANITVVSAENFTIEVKATRGDGFASDLAIDSVLLTNSACEHETFRADVDVASLVCPQYMNGANCDTVDEVQCNFDQLDDNDGLCIFANYGGDTFDWIRHKGKTQTKNTGPSKDHSTTGYYLYTESSYIAKDSVATLYSPLIRAGEMCVTLYFHMDGNSMGTLEIVFKDINNAMYVLSVSGNQKDEWHLATISVTSEQKFEIYIESIRGKSFRSDMAIDEFRIQKGLCQNPTKPNTVALPPVNGDNIHADLNF